VTFVTPGFFPTLGVNPLIGRVPREDELVRGGRYRNVVLSYGFWQREFGSSRAILDSTVILNDEPYQVLGVMPRDFRFPSEQVDAYVPYSTIPNSSIPRIRQVHVLHAIGRLKAGATPAMASADLNTIARRLAQEHPEVAAWTGASVQPLREAITGDVRPALLVLLGAVTFVLLMACVNVASLLLARASVREREIAVRAALGAGRGRIVRQLLAESVVLSLAGGILGVGIARAGVQVLLAFGAGQLPRGSDVHMDVPVLIFALVLSIATGLLFGIVPALHATRATLQGTLREAGRSVAGGARALRSMLVIGEVALAVVLVAGAGLMGRSFVALTRIDPGFRPDHLLAVNFMIDNARHGDHWQQYYHDVIDKARTVPGATSVAAVNFAPFRGGGEQIGFNPPGYVVRAGEDPPLANMLNISDGYFHTIGATMLAGREYLPSDRADGPSVIVVNEAFAKKWFPGQNAVGKFIGIGKLAEIVGVVRDFRQQAIDEPAPETIYINNMVNGRVKVTLVARTTGEPMLLARQLREAIGSVDKQQAITSIFTFDDALSDAMA
ncbi:MAG: ABC transporter permease, partial [Gemmatimonadaceae bacterium]